MNISVKQDGDQTVLSMSPAGVHGISVYRTSKGRLSIMYWCGKTLTHLDMPYEAGMGLLAALMPHAPCRSEEEPTVTIEDVCNTLAPPSRGHLAPEVAELLADEVYIPSEA